MCCVKNRRCKSSHVTSPLRWLEIFDLYFRNENRKVIGTSCEVFFWFFYNVLPDLMFMSGFIQNWLWGCLLLHCWVVLHLYWRDCPKEHTSQSGTSGFQWSESSTQGCSWMGCWDTCPLMSLICGLRKTCAARPELNTNKCSVSREKHW